MKKCFNENHIYIKITFVLQCTRSPKFAFTHENK